MGIKGIYGEIGPGHRIALAKLTINIFEVKGRPLRIAIDISIWQFQIQSGKGGTNPALRTLYYRLLRLLSLCIQPLFVFDGKNKPPFKRNKRTGFSGTSLTDFYTKKLLGLFGFPFHIAPGEAEAECALLQQEGIVDAVLSEDVDTLMFGCTQTLRNWSSEESRGSHTPTHVSLYDTEIIKKGETGLDREGMILVALMSGGDYNTEGIPGCGIKVACEAARAGYGKSLCTLSETDKDGLARWRNELTHELLTNESKYFRIKHKSLQVPNNFPNREVLSYYTHPIVSISAQLKTLKEEIKWGGDTDIAGLRQFVDVAFQWTGKSGAKKFIRGLAPALLTSKLCARATFPDLTPDNRKQTARNELKFIKTVCARRRHFSTGGEPELRIIYDPGELIGLDVDAEPDEHGSYGISDLAPVREGKDVQRYETEDEGDASERTRSTDSKKKAARPYDPNELDKMWVPELIAKASIPLLVEGYEESQRDRQKFVKKKFTTKKAIGKGGMPEGALEPYLMIPRPKSKTLSLPIPMSTQKFLSTELSVPHVEIMPDLREWQMMRQVVDLDNGGPHMASGKTIMRKLSNKASLARKDQESNSRVRKKITGERNPWAIAQSCLPVSSRIPRTVPHSSKPGVCHQENSKVVKRQAASKGALELTQNWASSQLFQSSVYEIPTHSERQFNEGFTRNHAINRVGTPPLPPQDAEMPKITSLSSIPSPEYRPTTLPRGRMGEYLRKEQDIINITSSPSSKSRTSLSDCETAEITPNLHKDTQNIIKEKDKKALFLVLRESLEGSWREAKGNELISAKSSGRSKAWRKSAIEVLDITGG